MNTPVTILNNTQLRAVAAQDAVQVAIIDIREPDEYAREHIPGSINIPLGKLEHYNFDRIQAPHCVFVCASGTRTSQARAIFARCGKPEVSCLNGGLGQWKECGFATAVNISAPLPIIRQVHMVAGTLIILGILLAQFINPAWMYLSLFVGCGLFFAGASGWCGMAKLLQLLPYNRSQ